MDHFAFQLAEAGCATLLPCVPNGSRCRAQLSQGCGDRVQLWRRESTGIARVQQLGNHLLFGNIDAL